MALVQVDLGCGNAKKDGYIGLDYVEMDQVDHVLDLTRDRYPFEDLPLDDVVRNQPRHTPVIAWWTPIRYVNHLPGWGFIGTYIDNTGGKENDWRLIVELGPVLGQGVAPEIQIMVHILYQDR